MLYAIGMTTLTFPRSANEPAFKALVQWQFIRGPQAIACDVLTRSRRTFEVCVVPFWDPMSAVVETYHDAADAMRRHAEIAWFLKESGWNLDRHTPAELVCA